MNKNKLIAGSIFAIAAGLFWFAGELFYGKADTLEAGLCCVAASFIVAYVFFHKIDNNRKYIFTGDSLGIKVTAISLLLTVLFLAFWKLAVTLESIYEASQNPLGSYHGEPVRTFFTFIYMGIMVSPLFLIIASPFGALAGWIYSNVTKSEYNECK